jgi:predicted Zn-dependent protease with MMP-like domain
MPDLIKRYQGPIEHACGGDETRIVRLVEETLHREIVRKFGLPDMARGG